MCVVGVFLLEIAGSVECIISRNHTVESLLINRFYWNPCWGRENKIPNLIGHGRSFHTHNPRWLLYHSQIQSLTNGMDF